MPKKRSVKGYQLYCPKCRHRWTARTRRPKACAGCGAPIKSFGR